MTLPALIQKQQKKEITVSLEKMYSTLMQAANTYQAQNGIYINDFDTSLSAQEFMEQYFNPFLKISSVCKNNKECWNGGRTPKALDGVQTINISYGVTLADGKILGANKHAGGIVFYFDVDGFRGSNQSGHDIFNFYLINSSTLGQHAGCESTMKNLKSGIYPGSYSACYLPHTSSSREELLGTTVHRACNKNAPSISGFNGDACAAVIMQDGWEMKKDYPW